MVKQEACCKYRGCNNNCCSVQVSSVTNAKWNYWSCYCYYWHV